MVREGRDTTGEPFPNVGQGNPGLDRWGPRWCRPYPVNRWHGATLVSTIVCSVGNHGLPDPDPEIETGVAHAEIEPPQRIVHHTPEGGVQALEDRGSSPRDGCPFVRSIRRGWAQRRDIEVGADRALKPQVSGNYGG